MQLESHSSTSTTFPRKRLTFKEVRWFLLGTCLLITCALSRYVVLWTDGGPMLLAKDRFSLSESFVSLDWINNAGTIEAKAKWPITFAALNRDGIMKPRAITSVRFKNSPKP